jgi:PAS domain S-box-containing protein
VAASNNQIARERHGELRLLEAVIDHIPAMIFIKDAEDLRFGRLNRAGEQLLGWSEESVLGKSDYDFFPPEQAEFFQRRDRETLAAGKVVEILEEPIRTRDGESRWLHTLKIPILGADGKPTHLLGISMDITPQKHAEQIQQESLRWLRAVFDQSPVGLMLIMGKNGERVEVNAHGLKLVGHSIERLGQYPDNLASLDGHITPFEERPSMRALRGERIEAAEYLLRTHDGTFIPIVLGAAPILGADGTIAGAIVSFVDNRATKELERLRADWSAIVAHDLRQPIHMLQLAAGLLLRANAIGDVRSVAERVKTNAGRLGRMVADLMDISRLDARRLEINRKPTYVAAHLRKHLELGNAPAVRLDVSGPDMVIDVDPDRLAQIMDNLLSNATKYGRAGAPILVEVAGRDGAIEISVTNEGPGILAADLPRIFERFERSAEARNGSTGIGLGLYITRGLVEAHGGRISVESGPDKTTFRFTLPRTHPNVAVVA